MIVMGPGNFKYYTRLLTFPTASARCESEWSPAGANIQISHDCSMCESGAWASSGMS